MAYMVECCNALTIVLEQLYLGTADVGGQGNILVGTLLKKVATKVLWVKHDWRFTF